MEPASYRILKSITVLTFFVSSIFWLSSQLVSVANLTYPVENEENQEIGTVTIPYDSAESQIFFFVLMVFSEGRKRGHSVGIYILIEPHGHFVSIYAHGTESTD